MHTPDVIQHILSEIANWNLKNVKFWGMDEGVWGGVEKNEPLFTEKFENLILELNMVPGVLLEP